MAQRTPPKPPATHEPPTNTSSSSRKSPSVTNAPNWRPLARKSRSRRRKPLYSIIRHQALGGDPVRSRSSPSSAAARHGARHRIVQPLHAEGDVLHDPVDEESRRRAHVAAGAPPEL